MYRKYEYASKIQVSSEVNFFHRARQGYLDLADKYPDKFLVVDAEKEFSKNLDLICEWLNIGKT